MTGLEQLKLAAKAGGVEVTERDGVLFVRQSMVHEREWNPRTDDGDALRLAARLYFHVNVFAPTSDGLVDLLGFVEVWREGDHDPLTTEYFRNPAHRYAATRLAITRAAALIGKDIP